MNKGKKNTQEERTEIVAFCIENGRDYGLAMEKYNVSYQQIYSWVYYLRKFTDKDELLSAIEEYIIYYSKKRYQLKLGCMIPIEYYKAYSA